MTDRHQLLFKSFVRKRQPSKYLMRKYWLLPWAVLKGSFDVRCYIFHFFLLYQHCPYSGFELPTSCCRLLFVFSIGLHLIFIYFFNRLIHFLIFTHIYLCTLFINVMWALFVFKILILLFIL